VTDAGVKDLAALKRLRTLELGATQVTDKGLKTLANFKTLESVYLRDTVVTDAGVEELQKALPRCYISK
jgi:hypothetical protein